MRSWTWGSGGWCRRGPMGRGGRRAGAGSLGGGLARVARLAPLPPQAPIRESRHVGYPSCVVGGCRGSSLLPAPPFSPPSPCCHPRHPRRPRRPPPPRPPGGGPPPPPGCGRGAPPATRRCPPFSRFLFFPCQVTFQATHGVRWGANRANRGVGGGNPALRESGPAWGPCDWPRLAMVAGAASL